jgi:hypothetical protein
LSCLVIPLFFRFYPISLFHFSCPPPPTHCISKFFFLLTLICISLLLFANQVEVCTGLGNGELDFYSSMADLESSWANISLQSPMVNYSSGAYFEVWIPYKKNPGSGNYEHVRLDQGAYQFDSSLTLNESSLWSPGYPSILRKKCVYCARSYGCYDDDCGNPREVHKCKFSNISWLHLQGLCETTSLGTCMLLSETLKTISLG